MADIKNTFSKGLATLNVKTSNFLELNKIKTYIATLNSEMEALKTELGEEIYRSWTQTGTVPVDILEEKFQMIRGKEQLIAEQETEITRISETERQILGEQESKSRTPRSGAAEGAEPVLVCPGCGYAYASPVKFCRKCGTRLN